MSARQIYQMHLEKLIEHTPGVRELQLVCREPKEFRFRAGQFVSLHVPVVNENGQMDPTKKILRAYSIASEEQQTNGFRLLFKHVPDGKASTYVWSLKGGETLQFTGPFGRVFFAQPPLRQVLFLNTGTGISQHHSYLKSFARAQKIKNEPVDPNLKFHLFFGLRTEADVYWEKELQELQAELPNFSYSYVLSRPSEGWKGRRGYVQNVLSEFSIQNTPTHFYLCGNGEMIKQTKSQLKEWGVPTENVFAEAFD